VAQENYVASCHPIAKPAVEGGVEGEGEGMDKKEVKGEGEGKDKKEVEGEEFAAFQDFLGESWDSDTEEVESKEVPVEEKAGSKRTWQGRVKEGEGEDWQPPQEDEELEEEEANGVEEGATAAEAKKETGEDKEKDREEKGKETEILEEKEVEGGEESKDDHIDPRVPALPYSESFENFKRLFAHVVMKGAKLTDRNIFGETALMVFIERIFKFFLKI
jgi:hypothetical protein